MCKSVGEKILLRRLRYGRFTIDLLRAFKKGCALKVEYGGVWSLWSQATS